MTTSVHTALPSSYLRDLYTDKLLGLDDTLKTTFSDSHYNDLLQLRASLPQKRNENTLTDCNLILDQLQVLWVPVYTIQNGQPVALTGPTLQYFPILHIFRLNGQQIDLDMPAAILVFLQCIDSFSRAKSQYQSVVKGMAFQELYDMREHDIVYIDGTRREQSFACPMCGIVLPMRHVNIDHQRPRSNGEVQALIKAMRVLGLTNAGPCGDKCVQLSTVVHGVLGTEWQGAIRDYLMEGMLPDPSQTTALPHYKMPRGRRRFTNIWEDLVDAIAYDAVAEDVPGRSSFNAVRPKSLRPQPGSTKADRYTLTMEGIIFYSFVRALNMEQELLQRTMHSLVNLRLLCGPCNMQRGNRD